MTITAAISILLIAYIVFNICLFYVSSRTTSEVQYNDDGDKKLWRITIIEPSTMKKVDTEVVGAYTEPSVWYDRDAAHVEIDGDNYCWAPANLYIIIKNEQE